ncbi:MAG: endonuclease [Comamonadaceae bacterium]|nr:MAG: endonuclease [Comamonadaceae bacterium]
MIVISWNIQWGRGVDGHVDLQRIMDTAWQLGDFDILCLQEVADNYPGLAGAGSANQFAQLAALAPGFVATEGIAVERHSAGLGRQRFGNMILSRFAPAQVLRHQLPWPADAAQSSMPRMALEAVFETATGPVRIMTTHLEYYAAGQRAAQVEALRAMQAEAAGHASNARPANQKGSPFEPRPRDGRAVLCGDFNCDASDALISRMQEPLTGAPSWVDAWPLARPGETRPCTVGVYDIAQWQGKPHRFDFFFVSQDLAAKVKRVDIDGVTQASDHQPLLLEIDLTR